MRSRFTGRAKPQRGQSTARAGEGALRFSPNEFQLVPLRDCPWRDGRPLLETPEQAADYWRKHVSTEPRFNPAVESLVVLLVNVRRRLLGHMVLSQGTKDTVLANVAEVFRPAVVANAAAVVLMHNHPSGDPSPSLADLTLTQELRQAGRMLQVQVLDHVIVGKPTLKRGKDFVSLKAMGCFNDSGTALNPQPPSKEEVFGSPVAPDLELRRSLEAAVHAATRARCYGLASKFSSMLANLEKESSEAGGSERAEGEGGGGGVNI